MVFAFFESYVCELWVSKGTVYDTPPFSLLIIFQETHIVQKLLFVCIIRYVALSVLLGNSTTPSEWQGK
jgi:hypothetical protein